MGMKGKWYGARYYVEERKDSSSFLLSTAEAVLQSLQAMSYPSLASMRPWLEVVHITTRESRAHIVKIIYQRHKRENLSTLQISSILKAS